MDVDVLDIGKLPEMAYLEQLAEDLAGTLSVIAFAGKSRDRRFIRRRQEQIRKKYERGVEHVVSYSGINCIIPAYDVLMGILETNRSSEGIAEDAENALFEYLRRDPLDDRDMAEQDEIFGEFQES